MIELINQIQQFRSFISRKDSGKLLKKMLAKVQFFQRNFKKIKKNGREASRIDHRNRWNFRGDKERKVHLSRKIEKDLADATQQPRRQENGGAAKK